MRSLCVLGSTGSIGTQTLEVCSDLGIGVSGISCNTNWKLAERQVRRFGIPAVCAADPAAAAELRVRLADTGCAVTEGADALCELAATSGGDLLVNALVGMAGLFPTLAAVRAGRNVALANKETLVAGGRLVTDAVRDNGVRLIPVDSEHSAIFQCLQDPHSAKTLRKIILTASGGPFFGRKKEELENVTVREALAHPNWSMGSKITVDSATLMNKAFEFIEAMWLFSVDPDQIEITVHRQSILHSAVEFADGAVLAQLGVPDMRIPIQYAITYPDRMPCAAEPLTIERMSCLTFERPDTDTFVCLAEGIKAAREGGLVPCAVNAANEVAVSRFLRGEIGFNRIGETVAACAHLGRGHDTYDERQLREVDAAAREAAASM